LIKLIRTNSNHSYFKGLVRLLDAELAERDGQEHAFYAPFNKIDTLQHVVIAIDDDTPIGCGAFKPFAQAVAEIKRMYVLPAFRGQGVAGRILFELERWAGECSFEKCILETGKRQPEAIALYRKNGYTSISNYGQYVNVENSVCFEKRLSQIIN